MKFGWLTLLDFHAGLQDEASYLEDTLSLFELADRLGYDTAWIGEEHFYHFGVCPSPQLLLAALARRTSDIRLGTAISLLPFENPLRKARLSRLPPRRSDPAPGWPRGSTAPGPG